MPTLLTILGVILYLRLGWVVGNAGLLGALGVILLGFTITGATGLSIASIATNTPLAGGGAYAIISRSLGLEAGGAIGVPLYLSQTLAIALYVIGFRGGWEFVFPGHPALVVDLVMFLSLFAIASISARFAFRVQYGVLALILASLVTLVVGAVDGSMTQTPTLLGSYQGAPEDGFVGTDFWGVFAVFFPATTGIMAGVNMSGELRDSRRSIPLGTVGAIVLTLVVYLGAAWWLARSAPPDVLISNYLVMIERSSWGPAVVAGLLGATFSSGLASIVGAPRILQALGAAELLPESRWFGRRTAAGEPRNALLFTSGVALAAILLRDLNVLAPIITLFFLITYAMINVCVLVEETLDLPTFRPTVRFPRIVPLVGAVGCVGAMVVVNPLFTVVAVALVAGFFVVLLRRDLDSPFSDVRGDVYAAIAQWATRRALTSRRSDERSWRPRVLTAVADPDRLTGTAGFLRDIAHPRGEVTMIGVGDEEDVAMRERLTAVEDELRDDQINTTWQIVDGSSVADGLLTGMRAVSIGLSRPNIVFMEVPRSLADQRRAQQVLAAASEQQFGVVMLATDHPGRLGGRGVINVWIREQGPDWTVSTELAHSHLAILLAYKLVRNWGGDLHLLTAVRDADQCDDAERYLRGLGELARLPGPPTPHALAAGFRAALPLAPEADLSVFALPPDGDFRLVRTITQAARTPCVFVRDSGVESAFI